MREFRSAEVPAAALSLNSASTKASERLKILVLEPFGGGSHASLYRGWQKYSAHDLVVLDLPAVHWKWRSRHASFTLAQRANELIVDANEFDLLFVSDMLNLPEWRGFARNELARLPAIAYFHENQFTYPLSDGEKRDFHYAYSNVLTAINAEEVWFNSEFHRDEFTRAAVAWLGRMPDFAHTREIEDACARSSVFPPGIDPPELRNAQKPERDVPTVGWVARWEHDKRPDKFLALVTRLLNANLDFELILLGQQFQSTPESLSELQRIAKGKIKFCGFAESAEEYWGWLSGMDFVVSTADHEFFGIGIVEAMRAGAFPLLPNRLAYPEVLAKANCLSPKEHLYDSDEELFQLLHSLVSKWIHPKPAHFELDIFEWANLAKAYDERCRTVAETQKR